MFVCYIVYDILCQDVNIVTSVQVVSFHKRAVGQDIDAILLSQLNQGSVRQIWMHLNLQGNRFDFAISQQIHQSLPIEIRHP